MDLYTLTKQFFPQHNIDRFFSLIWTERYYSAGDFQVVLPVIPYLIQQLAPGTLIGLRGVKEIMVVDTLVIANDTITVSGGDLVQFLNQRVAWFEDPGYDGSGDNPDGSSQPRSSGVKFADYSDNTQTAGEFISGVVKSMVIDPDPFDVPFMSINLDWNDEVISNLSLGNIDHTGGNQDLSFPIGQLYDSLVQIAQAQNVGFRLYLSSADYDTGDYSLKFSTYRGKDRTSDQTDRDLLRFSGDLDNFTGTSETYSNTDSKNVAYVTFQNVVSVHYPPWVDPDNPPKNFSRRVIRVDAPDIHLVAGDGKIDRFRARVAANTFRHQRDLTTVDGQVLEVPGQYRYPQDYFLGDLVELEGKSGLIVKATVAEYIRSQDQYGIKEYPTFQILGPTDPTFVGDPDYVPENGTPTFTGTPPTVVPDSPPGITDVPLTPTTPYETPDWVYDTDTGYYIHSGVFYIIGEATVASSGSDTLFTNIPAKYLPSSPVSCKVMVDHDNSSIEYTYDSGLTMGPYLDETVNLNGTITLDAGNPFRVAPGDESELCLILSGISWPTSIASADVPADTGSLGEWVSTAANIAADPDFTGYSGEDAWLNIDGGYAIHTGRLHLHGKIKAGPAWKNWSPMLNMPGSVQAKLDAGEPQSYWWVEVPSKNGYRTFTYTYAHILDQTGAQNPQASGNNGCGFWKQTFFTRYSDGFLARGTSPDLSFTPGNQDVGLEYEGCSGRPIDGSLPAVADWRGNNFAATVSFKPDDLIQMPLDTDPATVLIGDGQFCFVLGIDSGLTAYYKISIGYDPASAKPCTYLFYVPAIGDQILLASHVGVGPGSFFDGTSWNMQWDVVFSTFAGDVGFTTGDFPTYFWLRPPNTFALTGNSYEWELENSPVVPGAKGDMGIHIPPDTSCEVVYASISGVGDFPNYAEGDVIDFDGCGWPLL